MEGKVPPIGVIVAVTVHGLNLCCLESVVNNNNYRNNVIIRI